MTNIHMFVERKIGDTWQKVSDKKGIDNIYYRESLSDDLKKLVSKKTWSPGKHYALFGLLAGIRSKQVPAMVEPRGLPQDLSSGVRSKFESLKEPHTPSYFGLDELLSMKDNSTNLTYFLNAIQFKKYKKLGKIEVNDENSLEKNYTILAPRGSTLVSNDRMSRIMNMGAFMKENEYCTQVDQLMPYKEISPIFWNDIVAAMQKISKDPTKVRCVFWFED